MKRAFITAAVLSFAFTVPSFASNGYQQQGQAPDFEQKQAEILKHIDARAERLQEERSCVQAAKSFEDLKTCRDKQMAEMEKRRSEMKEHGPGDGQGPQ
jgi:hypothetical protein